MEDNKIYCCRCEELLDCEINWKEEYICPFADEGYCDECFYYLEGLIG